MTPVNATLESHRSRFWMTIAIMVTTLTVLWIALTAYQTYHRNEKLHVKLFRLAELRGEIVHLDEVLTMSARMAATTGEPRWEKRYLFYEPKLDAAIQEVGKIAPEVSSKAETDGANQKLVVMEHRALTLVGRHRLKEAQLLLFGPEYERQKLIYAQGMNHLSAQVQNVINEQFGLSQRRNLDRFAAAMCLVPILILSWLLTLRTMRLNQRALLESGDQLVKKVTTLAELNAALDKTTRDSEAARIATLNMMGEATRSKEKAEALNQELLLEIAERKRIEAALLQAREELESRVTERTAELGKVNESLRVENVEHEMTMGTLRQVAEALQQAKEEADAANAAKSEFLSRMSHELRTPLNAILGFGQILDQQELGPLSKESVGYILKGGRHLLMLINEVLDIARVEAGRLELSLEPVPLHDVVPEACALVRSLAAERGISLDENTPDMGRIHILADHQRLKQVLINLLANAIKYNRDGGEVEVRCSRKPDDWISIAIHDTGPGIRPQDLSKLFTPFERLGANTTDIEGTGLGLVLSMRLVTAMGGTLGVESVVDQGSTFTIELPGAISPVEQLAKMPEVVRRLDVGQATQSTHSVLCIEDNQSNLRLMEAVFDSRPEWSLMSAMQGSVGLDLARQHEPDLILLDLNLPDINGREVLARLQQSALTKDIPVVVISADATPNQIERLLAAGAKAYLTKPLDINLFLHTLDKFLLQEPTLASI